MYSNWFKEFVNAFTDIVVRVDECHVWHVFFVVSINDLNFVVFVGKMACSSVFFNVRDVENVFKEISDDSSVVNAGDNSDAIIVGWCADSAVAVL